MKIKIISLLILCGIGFNLSAQVDHSFTYQGELLDSGSPASGTFDITIMAFADANASGSSLASSVHTGVSVESGLFTIEAVNLGSLIYDGLDVWLQIQVKETSEQGFTVLAPLQKMHSVPYANTLVDNGATEGQVLTFNDSAGWVPAAVDSGTDDQNIAGLALVNTSLTVGIENGNSQTIDLAPIQDGTGTDDQNIAGSALNGTNLTIGIEGGNSQVVDVSSLQDGIGTDDQNISGSELNGTDLIIGIEGGNSQTVDMAPMIDGLGTKLIRVSDSAVLGKVIGVSFGTKEWTVINNNGFLMHINADGVPKSESALYNDGACAATPLYLQYVANSNASGSIVAAQGMVFTIADVGTYYVPKNTTLIDNAIYNKRRNSPTNCQTLTQPINTVIPILVNSEVITGVPEGGYGPVTVQ